MSHRPVSFADASFDTRTVHAGQDFDPSTGAVTPPIYQTSTFVQDGIGGLRRGYEYARSGNPTRTALEESLASLEGGAHAFAFSSGLAAEDALLRSVLRPGGRILFGDDVYGGTHRLITRVLGPWGLAHATVDQSAPEAVRDTIERQRPALVWIETPTNPLMKIVDIRTVADAAHEVGAIVVVDNTFASPALQQPIALGADVVVHSTTKYLGGHSDVLGGAVVLADDTHAEAVGFQQFAAGAVAGPMDAWLTSRGIKTLSVRMARHSENARAIAAHLEGHPAIERVFYPGLASHPGHDVAARQMRDFGGMVSATLKAGPAAARALAEHTRLFQLAESLGGVESLIGYPPEMTHASVRGTELAVPEHLVRLSVGIEDVADLVEDLDRALAETTR